MRCSSFCMAACVKTIVFHRFRVEPYVSVELKNFFATVRLLQCEIDFSPRFSLPSVRFLHTLELP
jgi:hypothetical protein